MATISHAAEFAVPAEIASTIVEPGGHSDETRLFQAYSYLREHNPLGLSAVDGFDPMWLVAKHADIMEIERQPLIFTSGGGDNPGTHNPILQNIAGDEYIRTLTGGSLRLADGVAVMDPPEHSEIKDITAAWFRPAALKRLDGTIRQLAQNAIATRLHGGVNILDFAQKFAFHYPLHVIMSLLGVPETDEPLMLALTQELFGSNDSEPQEGTAASSPEAAAKQFMAAIQGFATYFDSLIDDRRATPRDDMATVISLARNADGEFYERTYAYGWFSSIASAGHDTTSSTLSSIVEQLALDPALLAEVKSDLASTVPDLVNEGLRWASPVKHFMRRATRDYELRGRTIREGERLMLLYQSANRDEEVFAQPTVFDIHRRPNQHIAFGYGPHMCIGQHLAKQELRIMLEELLPRVRSIEVAGERQVTRTNFVGGLRSLPLRLEIE